MKGKLPSGGREPLALYPALRVLALLVALGWVAGWFIFLKPRGIVSVTVGGQPSPSRLCFWTQGETSSKVPGGVNLWSPILFSLPSPAGFSRMVPPPQMGISLPLMSDFLSPALMCQSRLIRAAPALSASSEVDIELLTSSLLRPGWQYRHPQAKEVRGQAETESLRPRARLQDSAGEASAAALDLPADLPRPPSGRVMLYLICDRDGLVSHVLPEEVDEGYGAVSRLVAAAARWQFRPSGAPRPLRVVVDWVAVSGD